jgi:hypothetical protein
VPAEIPCLILSEALIADILPICLPMRISGKIQGRKVACPLFDWLWEPMKK